MAIALKGTQTGASDQNGSNFTITLPGSPATNDLVLVSDCGEAGANQTMALVTSGYTQLVDIFANDIRDSNLGVYWKIMGGTPDTTVEIDGFGVAGEAHVGVVRVYSGVDTSNPIDVAVTTATGIDGTNLAPPGATSATAGAVAVILAGSNSISGVFSAPSGYTDFVDFQDVPGDGNVARTLSCEKFLASAGAEAPGILGDSGGTSNSWTAALVILRPAAGGGGISGEVDATLGAVTCAATGSLSLNAVVSKTLGALTAVATGSLSLNAVVSKTLGVLTAVATGTMPAPGINGALNKTLGLLTSVATGSLAIAGSLSKTLGSVILSATGENDNPVAPSVSGGEFIEKIRRRRR